MLSLDPEFRDEKFVPENMFSDSGKSEKFISLSLSISVSLSVCLSFVRPSVHPSKFISFFFSSRISHLKQKFVIFLVPKIRDENGNFFLFPKIGGETCSGTVFTRISGTGET